MGDTIESTQKELNSRMDKVESMRDELESKTKSLQDQQKSIDIEKERIVASSNYRTGISNGSLEQKALSYFGAKHPKDLLKINVCHPKFKGFPADIKRSVIELKKAFNTARHISQIFHGEPLDKEDFASKVKGMTDHYYGREELLPRIKAFSSTGAGVGDEWVPTGMSNQFIDEFELDKRVADQVKQLNVPTSPWDFPVKSGVTKARLIAENTSISDTNFGTDKVTFTASKFAEHFIMPEELNEDSAPAILQAANEEVVEAQLRSKEDTLLNGDDTATMDSDIGGATDNRRAFKGWRKLAIDNSANGVTTDFGNSAITSTLLKTLRTTMGKFGVNPRDLMIIVGPSGLNQIIGLPEVLTIDNFGPQATIVQGSIGNIFGYPIMTSEFLREDLNASGVHDGVTTDRAVVYMVNKARFWLGMRRPIQTRIMMDLPNQDRWLLSSYTRYDFQGVTQSATEKAVVLGFNVLT